MYFIERETPWVTFSYYRSIAKDRVSPAFDRMDSSLFFVRVLVVDLIHVLGKDQFNVVSLGLNGFGVGLLPSSNPEVLAVAVAIVNG